MADWLREISLQKTYGMGRTEAAHWAEREDGLSMQESADLHGVSYLSVRSSLQNGRMKILGRSRGGIGTRETFLTEGLDAMVVVCRGTEGNVADSTKYAAIMAVIRFMNKVLDVPVHEGTHVAIVMMPRRAGDVGWMHEHVFAYVNPQGCTIQQADAVADRMVELYENAGGTPEMLGTAVLRYWMDKMYMRYDIWMPEVEED